MNKRKFKFRYVYNGGATMTEFYNIPVIGIMLENETRLSTTQGSNDAMTAEEALALAEKSECKIISLKDFSELRKRCPELRKMFATAKSPFDIRETFVWTIDEAGKLEAYSLETGYMMMYEKKAGVMLRLE